MRSINKYDYRRRYYNKKFYFCHPIDGIDVSIEYSIKRIPKDDVGLTNDDFVWITWVKYGVLKGVYYRWIDMKKYFKDGIWVLI